MTIEEAMERVLHMQQRLERQYSLADATSLRLILDEVERLRALEYHTALADRVEDVMGGRSAAEARAKRLADALRKIADKETTFGTMPEIARAALSLPKEEKK